MLTKSSKSLNQNNTTRDWLSGNLVFWLSFIIPIFIMGLMYMMREIYPFGDQMYLRSDMYHQYAPFYQDLANKIANGGSLTYTWNVGMGMNFTALAAYYLASPFNIILGCFTGEHIIEVMSVLIILKIALSSLAFTYYLSKHFHTKELHIAVFGLFYATSSYFAAFSWNIMWLDCMLLLPLIILGLERLVKQNKCLLYGATLGLAIFSNYYIAIMLCIFSVIYFVYLIIVDDNKKDLRYYLKRLFHFAVFSGLAGGMAACLVIPEYFALMLTASGEFNFPETLTNYFSIFDMVSRSLMNVPVAIFEPHDPNLYCTVAVFLFLPLYWMNKETPVRQKVGKTVLLAIFLISFNMNIPNYIWHGLHFPNSLPCRQSFIYIFLILTMSYEGLRHVKEYSNKQIFGVFGAAVAIMILIEELYVSSDFDFTIVYFSLGFLVMYMIVMFSFRNKNARKVLTIYLLFVVAITEIIINTNETALSVTSRTYYVSDNTAITKLIDRAKAQETNLFYRTEKYTRRTKNDSAWHQYRGMSTFSSTAVEGISNFYNKLGLQESYNAYAFYGATPVTASLFSVKYVFSNDLRAEYPTEELFGTELTDDNKEIHLYENKYTLPIGFMIPSDTKDNWDFEASNPFYVQNSFIESATGVQDVFMNVNMVSSGNSVSIEPEGKADIYFYVNNTDVEKVDVSVYSKDGSYVSGKGSSYSNLNHNYICHIGVLEEGETATVTINGDSDVSVLQLYAYSFNADNFIEVFNLLNEGGLTLTHFEDTKLEGVVTAKEDGMMYTSISYEKGWKVYVDGEEVKTECLKDALLTFPVSAGTHSIRFEYFPEGLKTGLIISGLSLGIFLLIAVFAFIKYKNSKSDNKNSAQVIEKDSEFEWNEDAIESDITKNDDVDAYIDEAKLEREHVFPEEIEEIKSADDLLDDTEEDQVIEDMAESIHNLIDNKLFADDEIEDDLKDLFED